jgi:hypothetical protein
MLYYPIVLLLALRVILTHMIEIARGPTDMSSAWYFAGSISSIQLYNRALTADEVRRNYEATVGRYT